MTTSKWYSTSEEKKAFDWLIKGGGGHEYGEDGLRATRIYGAGLVWYLAAYAEYLKEQSKTTRRRAMKNILHKLYGFVFRTRTRSLGRIFGSN